MHRHTKTTALVSTLAGLMLGGCLGDYHTSPGEVVCCEAPDAGQPPPEPEQPSQPIFGARLAPYLHVYSDGTTVHDPKRLWDTERDEACEFVEVAGGNAYCLPAFVWNTKPGWFADSRCTQEVAIVDACERLPRYLRDDTSKPWQTCEPRPLEALRPLGEPLPMGAPLYSTSSGQCAQQSAVDTANAALPLGEPVPLGKFVSAHVEPSQ